ncbi:MAG: hypothetical protein WA191_27190 [Telluria sp.]
MKLMRILILAGSMAATTLAAAAAPAPVAAPAATPGAAQVKAVQDLLASMQAEKMMRTTAGTSRYSSEQQKQAVFDKLAQVPPAEIHRRLAVPVARFVSTETAIEMTRFYGSSYGKRVLYQTYNSKPTFQAQEVTPTKAEQADLKRPAYLKAAKALKAAEPAIQHESFVLLTQIMRK